MGMPIAQQLPILLRLTRMQACMMSTSSCSLGTKTPTTHRVPLWTSSRRSGCPRSMDLGEYWITLIRSTRVPRIRSSRRFWISTKASELLIPSIHLYFWLCDYNTLKIITTINSYDFWSSPTASPNHRAECQLLRSSWSWGSNLWYPCKRSESPGFYSHRFFIECNP